MVPYVHLCYGFTTFATAPVRKVTGIMTGWMLDRCWRGVPSPEKTRKRARLIALVMALSALSTLAYLRSLWLPLISGDYLQVQLGRQYGPVSSWPALAADPLYRSRSTSILLTHWTEQ